MAQVPTESVVDRDELDIDQQIRHEALRLSLAFHADDEKQNRTFVLRDARAFQKYVTGTVSASDDDE